MNTEHRRVSWLDIVVIVVMALAVLTVLTIAAGGPLWVPPAIVGGIGAFVAIAYFDHKINDGTAGGWNAGGGDGFGGGDGGGC